MHKIMSLGKIVNQLETPIENLEPVLDKVESNLKTAKSTTEKVMKVTEPVKKKVIAIEKQSNKIKKALSSLEEKAVKPTRHKTQEINECLGGYEKDSGKPCSIQKHVFELADNTKPGVDDVNDRLSELETAVRRANKALDSLPKVGTEITSLSDLIKELGDYQANLDPLYDKLKELKNQLDKKVGFSFPYPTPTFDNPLKMSYKKFRISVYDGLHGYGYIKNLIKKYLSDTLYKVLDGLGIGKYIKQIQDEAKKAVNYLIKPLKELMEQAMGNSISGLKGFSPSFSKIDANMGAFDSKLPIPFFEKYGFTNNLIDFGSIDWYHPFSSISCEAVCFGNPVELTVKNHGPWGSYGKKEFCPKGHFINSYKVRMESKQGNGDDTSMNAIKAYCDDGKTALYSKQSHWGKWKTQVHCPNGEKAAAFQLKVEGKQGSGDDTSANSVKVICRADNETSIRGKHGITSDNGHWGKWTDQWATCPAYTAFCGMRTKVEGKQGNGDDTALNDIKFTCCPID